MLARVFSGSVIGIDAFPVEVEVDISRGLPAFSTVGLPDNAVKESKDRVKSAVKNSGYEFPAKRITVNLAPADIKKEGTIFDLPVAVGILKAEGLIKDETVLDYLVLGELSLDGRIKPVRGALSIGVCAKGMGKKLILPVENSAEAAVVDGLEVFGISTLSDVVGFLNGDLHIEPCRVDSLICFNSQDPVRDDLSDVKGQEHVKRALEVAAAGGHNLLMIGPPGSGKTMLARRLPTILPDMTLEEAIETTKVHSVAGMLGDKGFLITERPFRAPHHSISDAGLIGGGQMPRPGEVSLAHNGVLFLDEMPEFKKNVLEAMRQPLEESFLNISRAALSVTYPANFMLVGAMNPCPCGYLGDPRRECLCTPMQIQRYRARLSGPLLDRIDIHCEVPSVRFRELNDNRRGETSAEVKKRVERARSIQRERFRANKKVFSNSRMTTRHIKRFCTLDGEGTRLIEVAMEKLGLSARAYTRVLKVARTIADLDGEDKILPHHLSEAIQYRTLDRAISA